MLLHILPMRSATIEIFARLQLLMQMTGVMSSSATIEIFARLQHNGIVRTG